MTSFNCKSILLAAVACGVACITDAQVTASANPSVATGIYSFGSFEGSPDSVNLGNLNVHMTIPIRMKAGRKLDFQYGLNFDSSVWTPSNNSWGFVDGAGWSGTRAVVSADLAGQGYTTSELLTSCLDQSGNYFFESPNADNGYNYAGIRYLVSDLTYTDMLGVVHQLPGFIEGYQCNPAYPNLSWTYGNLGAATDGSGIVTSINSSLYPQGGSSQPVVQFSVPGIQSTSYANTFGNIPGSPNVPSVEVDRNGNEILFTPATYVSHGIIDVLGGTEGPIQPGTYVDTLGTTALTISEQNVFDASNLLLSGKVLYSYLDGNGSTSSYVLHYSKFAVQTAFGCSGTAEASAPLTVSGADASTYYNYLPDYIMQPDGRQYSITYEPTPGYPGYVTGRMESISFPTGGSITYSYGSPSCDGTVMALSRTINDSNGNTSLWSYARTFSNGQWTTLVTDPSGNQKQLAFINAGTIFYETGRQEYSGTVNNGTMLRSTATLLNNGDTIPVGGQITSRTITTTLPGATNKVSQISESYDSLGSLTLSNVFDYGNNAVGPLLYQKINAYDPVDAVFDTVVETVEVNNGPNAYVIGTAYTLDSGTLTTTTGTPQHTNGLPTASRGNVTSITRSGLAGGTPVTVPITTLYNYYDTGEVAQVTDLNGTGITNYSYNQCGGAFQTGTSQVIVPSNVILSTSTNWDCNGGLPTSQTDVNGHISTFQYQDPLWRISSATDALGNSVAYAYPTVNSNKTTVSQSYLGGVPGSTSVSSYDGLGRLILSQTTHGSNTSYQSTAQTYDTLGHVSAVTQPYFAALGVYTPTAPRTSTNYDAIGRQATVSYPGGATTSFTYGLNDVLVTNGPAASGENAKSRRLEYNGLGILTSVCEVTSGVGSGACGQSVASTGYLTTYSYTGQFLTSVNQSAQAGSSATQSRTVAYDALGRKASETIPETGTSSFTYDIDRTGTCTASSTGDVVKTVDNMNNVTCMSYDSMHRLLSSQVVSGPYASSTPQSHFIYDAATLNGAAMQNALGTKAEAYTCSGTCTTKLTDLFQSSSFETVNNQNTGRIISNMWESTPNSGGYFLSQSILNANGTMASIGASLNGAAIGFPTVTYGLDGSGRPSVTTDTTHSQTLVSNASYNNATGAISGITLGNGDADTIGYDPNTGMPTSFQYSIAGSSPFNIAGSLTWNQNGSLQNFTMTDSSDSSKNQNCGYQMDDINRLISVNCAGSWAQNFSYDPFGNIWKGPPSNPGLGQITQSYTAGYNAMTNQANSGVTASYDANGNQTIAETNNLSWNATAQPVNVNGISATYDAMGRLVETSADGNYTQSVYDPSGNKIAAVQGGQVVSATVSLPGGDSAIYNSSGLNYFRHMDWLGSSRLATTWNHSVYSKEAYAPFGETYNESATPDRSFAGHDQDANQGVYDALFRRYDPVAGRWMSPDPSGWGAVNTSYPQSLNRYSYVQNNPMSLVDPQGLSCFDNDGYSSQAGGCTGYGADNPNPPWQPPPVLSIGAPPIESVLDEAYAVYDAIQAAAFWSNSPFAPNNFTKHYGLTTPCGSSASQVMGAVESNFARFGNYSRYGGAESVSFAPPAGMGVGSTIPITVGIMGINQSLSVNVAAMNSQSMTFTTNPGHLIYPGYITFAASPASPGAINFNINLGGTVANSVEFNFGGSAFEDAQWNHFLGQVSGFCEVGG